jgi:hypothetical protein
LGVDETVMGIYPIKIGTLEPFRKQGCEVNNKIGLLELDEGWIIDGFLRGCDFEV